MDIWSVIIESLFFFRLIPMKIWQFFYILWNLVLSFFTSIRKLKQENIFRIDIPSIFLFENINFSSSLSFFFFFFKCRFRFLQNFIQVYYLLRNLILIILLTSIRKLKRENIFRINISILRYSYLKILIPLLLFLFSFSNIDLDSFRISSRYIT